MMLGKWQGWEYFFLQTAFLIRYGIYLNPGIKYKLNEGAIGDPQIPRMLADPIRTAILDLRRDKP